MPENADRVDLDGLLKENLLWVQAGDAGDLTGEALNATRSSVSAVGHEVPTLKTGYLDFVRALANRVQKSERKSDGTTR